MNPTMLGIVLMTTTWLLYAIMSALAKHTYNYAPPAVSFFFQNFVALLIVTPLLLRSGMKAFHSSQPKLLFLRGVGGAISFYCYFHSLSYLPLTDSTVLQNTTPLFVPLILLFGPLKQKSPWPVWAALSLGFAGVLFIFPPQSQSINVGTCFGILAGLGTALTIFVIRALSQEPALRIMFYYFLIASVATFPFACSAILHLPLVAWGYYLCIGLIFVTAQLAYTYSLRYACPSVTAPFTYSMIIGAVLIDCFVWGHLPSGQALIGIALVIGGGGVILWKLKKEEKRTEA